MIRENFSWYIRFLSEIDPVGIVLFYSTISCTITVQKIQGGVLNFLMKRKKKKVLVTRFEPLYINVFMNLLILLYCQQIVTLSRVFWLSCLVSKLFQKSFFITAPNISPYHTYPFLSQFQEYPRVTRINTLVQTKDILHFSECQNISIMTRGINVRCSVTPVSLMSDVL